MEESRTFAPLLLVVFLAFIVPLVLVRFKRLRLPIVVGEIIAGIIIGRSGLAWVEGHDPVLDLLAEFGFVFLMFLSGMEIDFSNIKSLDLGGRTKSKSLKSKLENLLNPVPLGTISFLLTLALSAVIGFGLMRMDLNCNPWMIALILSTTSLGVVLPVLKEQGLSSGRYGQTLLISALIADFATMLLITVLVAALSEGLTLDILLIGVLFLAFFMIYRLGNFFFNRLKTVRLIMQELSHATAQIKVRAAFTMMLIFVVLSEVLGAEIILGAFLAGAIISLLRTPEDAELSSQLEAIGFGFFIPIFFIMVGVNFNLTALLSSTESLLLVPILLFFALLVKFLPTMLYRFAYSWRETFAAGSLLSSRLSLIIAASAIGLRMNLISEAINSDIILVAIITVTISPLLFIRIMPHMKIEKIHPLIVAGAGELGIEVTKGLLAHGEQVVLIDRNEQRIQRARDRGYKAFLGAIEDPTPDIIEALENAQALVSTHADTEYSYRICSEARSTYGIDHVIAQVSSPNDLPLFEQIGVATMNAALDRSALLVLLTRNPAMYQLLTRTDDDKEVMEVVVHNPGCVGKLLREIHLPGDALVMALRRNGDLLVPHGNTRIEFNDHLTLVGSLDCMDEVRYLFGYDDQPAEIVPANGAGVDL